MAQPRRNRPGDSPAKEDFWQASETAMARGRAARPGNPAYEVGPTLIFMVAFAAFALLTPDGLPNGDAAVYAQQVLQGDFASRPVHLGYYLLAALLTAGRQVPDYAFNLISALFGAATLAVVFGLARRYLRREDGHGDWRLALVAPAALFGNALFVENAVHAEIYGAQTFFLLAALLLWLRDQPIAAGLSFGVAGLVTPSAALFAPAFLLIRRPRPLARLLTLGATALAVVLLPILPLLGDYLHGDRGLLAATRKGMGPLQIAAKEGFEVGIGFLAFLPLLALGLWRAARKPELRPLLAAAGAAWAVVLIFGERFSDVPAQLPTLTLAAVFAALGAAELLELLGGSRPLPVAPKILFALLCLAAAAPVAALLFLRTRAASVAPVGPAEVACGLAALLLALFVGWRYLSRARPGMAVALLVAASLLASAAAARSIVLAKNARIDGYREEALELGARAASSYLAVGSWERGILLEHYLYRRSYTEHFINVAWLAGGWGAERQAKAEADLAAAIAGGRQIWLLGPAPEAERRLTGEGFVFEPDGPTLRRARRAPLPASPSPPALQPSPEDL